MLGASWPKVDRAARETAGKRMTMRRCSASVQRSLSSRVLGCHGRSTEQEPMAARCPDVGHGGARRVLRANGPLGCIVARDPLGVAVAAVPGCACEPRHGGCQSSGVVDI